MSGAPAMSRAISPRSARAASSSGWSAMTRRARTLKAELAREGADRKRAGVRSRTADDAQGALRIRAFLDPYVARRLGNGGAGRRRDRAEADRCHPAAAAARGYRAAVRLCQGRADGAGDPQRHRRRAQARQAGHRRSQERQSRDLSRRDADHAQSQGIRGGDPQPRRFRATLRQPRGTRCSSPTARPSW